MCNRGRLNQTRSRRHEDSIVQKNQAVVVGVVVVVVVGVVVGVVVVVVVGVGVGVVVGVVVEVEVGVEIAQIKGDRNEDNRTSC